MSPRVTHCRRLTQVERKTIVCVQVVSCCRLDYQRPPGQDWGHPDDVVFYQRRVDQTKAALSRLHGRPEANRDMWWNKDEVWMEWWIESAQNDLHMAKCIRDNQK